MNRADVLLKRAFGLKATSSLLGARFALAGLLFLALLPAQDATFLVSQKAASSVGFYTSQGKHLTSVAVGAHPHEMVLSPDGRFAYTTDNGTMAIEQAGAGGNTVSIVDVEARRKVGEISLGKYHRPHGIDYDPHSGNLLVTTENPDQLLLVDPKLRKVLREYDTGGRTPHIVTVSLDGKSAYVSNARSGTVAVIALDSGEITLIPSGDRPEGSVLSKDGNTLYVAHRESHNIAIIDTRAKKKIGDIKTGKGPVRVGISGDGRYLAYALITAQQVGIADIAARSEIAAVDLDGGPVSLHVSSDGDLAFAAAQDIDTVYVVSIKQRKILREFKTTSGAGPDPVMRIHSR